MGGAGGAANGGDGRPRGLTCDLWYTLIYFPPRDRDEHIRRRWAAWSRPLREHGRSSEDATAWLQRLLRWGRAREANGQTPTLERQIEWLAARTRVPVAAFAGVPEAVDRSLLRCRVRPAPGVEPVLDALADARVRLGIVSNILFETGDGTRAIIDRLDLTRRFGSIVLSSDYRWSKPSPRPFLRCLSELGVRPSEAAHIGDLPYDVVGAARAGLRPFLYTGLHAQEASLPPMRFGRRRPTRVARWAELPGRLRALGWR